MCLGILPKYLRILPKYLRILPKYLKILSKYLRILPKILSYLRISHCSRPRLHVLAPNLLQLALLVEILRKDGAT